SDRIFAAAAVRHASAGEMKLATTADPAAGQRGLRAIPPVLLLPVLVAIGHYWLFAADAMTAFRYQETLTFIFTYLPLQPVPLAVALAVGLYVYAEVRLPHAVLAGMTAEALNFAVLHAYYHALATVISQQDLRDATLVAWIYGAAVALTGLALMLA